MASGQGNHDPSFRSETENAAVTRVLWRDNALGIYVLAVADASWESQSMVQIALLDRTLLVVPQQQVCQFDATKCGAPLQPSEVVAADSERLHRPTPSSPHCDEEDSGNTGNISDRHLLSSRERKSRAASPKSSSPGSEEWYHSRDTSPKRPGFHHDQPLCRYALSTGESSEKDEFLSTYTARPFQCYSHKINDSSRAGGQWEDPRPPRHSQQDMLHVPPARSWVPQAGTGQLL